MADLVLFSSGMSSGKSTIWMMSKVERRASCFLIRTKLDRGMLDNFELTGWAAFGLLAFYMAVSNILLVNLLVAMFS